MLVEIAHFALAMALGLSLVQMIIPVWGVRRNDIALARVGEPAAISVFVLLLFAFGVLMYAYAVSDFSVVNVAENSHSAKPMIYKLTGVLGQPRGLDAALGADPGAVRRAGGISPNNRCRIGCAPARWPVQASVTVAFLLFILFTSNPFNRLDPAPPEGNDLNPLLQDPASRSIRRCSTWAMSASRSPSPLPSRR
jgi:cytochrome c-type biogenesis protein CcmF